MDESGACNQATMWTWMYTVCTKSMYIQRVKCMHKARVHNQHNRGPAMLWMFLKKFTYWPKFTVGGKRSGNGILMNPAMTLLVPSKRSSADGSWVAWVRAVFMQQFHLILMSVVWWLLGTHELYYGLYSCTSILVVKGALMLSSQMYVEYKWILELNPPDHQPILVGAIFRLPREHPTSYVLLVALTVHFLNQPV